jgi:hypothetical protein
MKLSISMFGVPEGCDGVKMDGAARALKYRDASISIVARLGTLRIGAAANDTWK